MGKKFTLRHHRQDIDLFNRRSIIALIAVFLFAFIIIGRLAYLQIFEHHFYTTLSKKNIINIIPVQPKRGLIYDRFGVLLAKDIPVYSLDLIPEEIKHMTKTITALRKILPITAQDIQFYHHALKNHRPFQPVPLVAKLTQSEMAKFYVNQYRFPGVSIGTHTLRYYPNGKITSNVVGYVGRITEQELAHVNKVNYSASDDIGKTGIEAYYEKALHGTVGAEEVEMNAQGRIVRIIKKIPPIPGENIYLTIDSKLQAFAEKTLGDNAGAVVAIQPATGQVLALATKPDFNPNPFVTGISQKAYNKLLNAPGRPLYDRAIRGLYAPGSTIKPFYALGALSDHVITKDYRIFDPGWFRLPGSMHVFHDWKFNGHGWVNVSKAIIVSCDTFFYNLASLMGIHRMDATLHMFGFGHTTGIDMPNELSGIVPSPRWKERVKHQPWYTGDTIIAGIGQGSLLVTPLQLAAGVATIAEHGKRFRPNLVLKTVSPSGVSAPSKPILEKPVALHNKHAWDTVIKAMQNVINSPYGTALFFGRNPPFTAAGKTGTAQIFGSRNEERSDMFIPKRLRDNHLFIVFAPIKHPQIALAIVVEHASFADEMSRHIIDFYFQQLSERKKKDNHHATAGKKLT